MTQAETPTPLLRLAPRGFWIASILGLAYAASFSALSLLQHAAFHTHAFDLGLHQQAAWSALHGEGLRYTLFLAWHPQLTSLLGDHVNLILFPISLLYFFHDGPETLLVVQALIVGSAAIPLFGLARRLLGSAGLGVAFAAVFLLHPAIHGANLYDFHAVLPAAAFVVWAFYLAEAGSRYGLAVVVVLALSCQENTALVVALLGVWMYLRGRRRAGPLVFLAGVGWFAVCFFWILPAFNPGTGSNHFTRYAHLGATWAEVARNLVLHPTLFLGRLADPQVQAYLVAILAPTGFLGILAPEVLLVAGSEIGLNLLSDFPPQTTIDYQYAAMTVAVASVAAVYGTARLKRAVEARRGPSPVVAKVAAIAALAASVVYHAQSYGTLRPLSGRVQLVVRQTDHSRLGARFLAQIPPGVPVSAQSDVVPHLCDRRSVYLFPEVRDAEFVLLNAESELFPVRSFLRPGRSPEQSYNEYVQDLITSGRFRIQDVASSWILLARNAGDDGRRAVGKRTYHRAEIRVGSWPSALPRGGTTELETTVVNTSTAVWFPQHELPGGYQVNLSYHWRAPGGEFVVFDGERTALPARMAPGEAVTVRARVRAPETAGDYVLQLDLVQERVAWFESQGSPAPSAPVTIR